MPEYSEVIAVQLRGRENRFKLPFHDSLQEAAQEIVGELRALPDLPLILFGHSLGGALAYECTLTLWSRFEYIPLRLVVSATRPPHLPLRGRQLHDLPENELIRGLINFGGTPAEVLRDADCMRCFLPRIRSDFRMSESYSLEAPIQVRCPLTVLYTKEDTVVDPQEMPFWEAYASQNFAFVEMSGDHFFAYREQEKIVSLLLSDIGQPRYLISRLRN